MEKKKTLWLTCYQNPVPFFALHKKILVNRIIQKIKLFSVPSGQPSGFNLTVDN